MEAIDFRIELKPTAPMKLLEMLKHFLKVKGFLFLYPGSETKAVLAPVNASREAHRPTVWDSGPISVRLMFLIYQRESSVVSAAAEDKTSPPPEIILLSFPVSYFTMAASMRQVSILAFVEGEKKKKSGIQAAGRE